MVDRGAQLLTTRYRGEYRLRQDTIVVLAAAEVLLRPFGPRVAG